MKSTLVRSSNNLKGIIFMLLTCVIVTTSAILIKTLGQELNTFQVVMLRCFFTLMITLTFNFHLGKILFRTNRPKMMAYRTTLTYTVVVANFYAVSNLPLIEVTALQFSKPLFLYLNMLQVLHLPAICKNKALILNAFTDFTNGNSFIF